MSEPICVGGLSSDYFGDQCLSVVGCRFMGFVARGCRMEPSNTIEACKF